MMAKLTLYFTLLLLIVSGQLSTARQKVASVSDLPLLNTFATKSGDVHLRNNNSAYWGYGGYYAVVDFQYSYSDDTDTDETVFNTHSGAMTIGLYTSQTWLSNNTCQYFTAYNCEANSCNAYPWWNRASENLPYLEAEGYYASASMYLDYNNWALTHYAAITSSCISGANYYGYGKTGVLGMGLANGSNSNFYGGTATFSIYLDKSNNTGQLQFRTDESKIDNSSTSYSLTTDSNWHVNVSYAYFYFTGQYSYYAQMSFKSMIFDLEYSSIGIPYNDYNTFISYFEYASGISCTSDYSYPTCSYYGNMSDLPTVSLYIQNIQYTYIPIPPQVYIKDAATYNDTTYLYTFNLNVRALFNSFNGENYVTEGYSNTLIMGSDFMKYYYTVFQGPESNSTVTLYVAAIPPPPPTPTPTPTPPSPDNNITLLVLLTVGSVAFVICVVCCCCHLCKKKRANINSKVVPSNFIESSAEAPLVYNTEGINNPYPQIAPNYNQLSYPYGTYQPYPQFQGQGQYYATTPDFNYPQGNTPQ